MLEELRKIKKSLEREGLHKLVLFGSRARGDAEDNSDWDFLVLVSHNDRCFDDMFDRYGWPLIKCGMEHDEDISVHLYSLDEWESYRDSSLLYYNVVKEGVEI